MKPQTLTRAVAAFAFAFSMASGAHAQMKIGHMGSMTGTLAALGADQYDGFMLRVDQGDGKLGGQDVEVIRVDGQAKPEAALQAARELIQRERVDVMVGMTASNVINAVFPYVVENKVPLVGTNGGPSPIAGEQCSPWFVSTAFQNDGPHEAAGQEAHNRGYKNVAVIAPNYQAGRDAIAGFKRFYKGELAEELYPGLGQADFSAEITQLTAIQPDAVYVFLPGAMGINFIKQYSQAGMMDKFPLLSSFTIDDITIPALQDAALGSLVSTHWVSGATNPKSQEFIQAFEAKYNRTPSNYAMQGYDAAALIDQALTNNPDAVGNPEKLIEAMRGATLDSPRGEITFNRNGFPIQNYALWKVVTREGGGITFEKQHDILEAHEDAYVSECPIKS